MTLPGADLEGETAAPVIARPYLLALNVPVVRTDDGGHYADPSWAKDLIRHTTYLPALTYFGPVEHGHDANGLVRLPDNKLRVTGYPAPRGRISALTGLLPLALRLWREVGRADIVHTGVAGHPVPVGWLAIPMARLRRRRVISVIESAFWRVPTGAAAGKGQRLRSAVWERVNRWMMRRVHHAFWTHREYQDQLPAPGALTAAVTPATWIDDEDVLSEAAVRERWAGLLRTGTPPRFLFAARLVTAKGTEILLDALDHLAGADANLCIDVIGTGSELENMAARVRDGWAARHVRILAPREYGPAFFALLDDYDAVLIPSVSDEQPRIIFDAYARGVAVIGSDLAGIRGSVTAERTGRLVAPGDAAALARAVVEVADDRERTAGWALAGRDLAAGMTHGRMHRDRAALLAPFYTSDVPR